MSQSCFLKNYFNDVNEQEERLRNQMSLILAAFFSFYLFPYYPSVIKQNISFSVYFGSKKFTVILLDSFGKI